MVFQPCIAAVLYQIEHARTVPILLHQRSVNRRPEEDTPVMGLPVGQERPTQRMAGWVGAARPAVSHCPSGLIATRPCWSTSRARS
jgi:hypothetical protein